ncbi:MAG TPA: filamentous hemagglutinin family protein, partial [Rhizomicrobium sp.]|nr:filamentous hemagglutinin family protein [Rhizomicrobium sp.]
LPTDGTIVLAAGDLSNLNASSLLIGGVRTDNTDGTTSLALTAKNITVENDADHTLTAPEVVLAVDGSGSAISVHDGASITATGTFDDTRTGDYILDGAATGMTGQGAVLRVSNGVERQVTRKNIDGATTGGLLDVGAASLSGKTLLLDSSGDVRVSPNASIDTSRLAIGAGKVTFTSNPAIVGGLVITPELQTLFGNADQLTIRTPQAIDFSAGTYSFGNLNLDTPGLQLIDGAAVTINADALSLKNSGGAATACAPACGTGTLAIVANSIDFGSGTVRLLGYGNGAKLTATNGIIYSGQGTFDAGTGQLGIATPFIGDRAVAILPGQTPLLPNFAIVTTGAIAITKPSRTTATLASGTPGSSLSLSGDSVSVSGSDLRATAGQLKVAATHDITVTNGAIIETPGYSKVFGDTADPYEVSAPGGNLSLVSSSGNLVLGSGTTLSVGGGKGRAGALILSAANGTIDLSATIDANAPDKGASLSIDENGAFDLSTLPVLTHGQFTGDIAIRTGTGDLVLVGGQTLAGDNVTLIADGGLVDIAGMIDVSGVNGGNVNLFGKSGVALESTAKIDAHATGYAETDSRQAKGGDVEIGTDGAGKITVASGALIDVSALRTGDRLIPTKRNGEIYYVYAPADLGGTVSFRAPIIEQAGADTVSVFYNGNISGARSIVLEAFKRFDLGDVASNPNFVGVTINSSGQAVLDLTATGTASQHNFLADDAAGTLVDFVQSFDVSGASGHLGNLTSDANFHERPGMELSYSGDVVLNSNWNLGAGTVDVAGAIAAGLMAESPSIPGKFYVIPGKEPEVFQRFTNLTYRVGGAVDGEPGALTIRAGGTLDIKGSISDGFFQFRDQTNPDYLNVALGGGNPVYSPYLTTVCFGGTCDTVAAWQALGVLPSSYVTLIIPAATSLAGLLQNPAPYSASANSPAALGSLPGNTGDPFGSADLFPRLTLADGSTKPVESTSYRLVGGGDLTSVEPLRVSTSSTAGVTVEGEKSYTYSAPNKGISSFDSDLSFRVGTSFVDPNDWYQAFVAANPTLDPNAYTFVNFQTAPQAVRDFLVAQAPAFFASHPGQFEFIGPASKPTGFSTTMALASEFMAKVFAPNFSTLVNNYKPPSTTNIKAATTATTRTLVRTGSGDISVSAAGDIDLRNGNDPVYRTIAGVTTTEAKGGIQVGGTAIYTAGYRADLTPRTVVDEISHATFTIDPSGHVVTKDVFATPSSTGYRYGAGGAPDAQGVGYTGILIANPVYAEGGGDVELNAGRDVLGRRDMWAESRLATYYDRSSLFGYDWIGSGTQPWRTGQVDTDTEIRIDPQLFTDGVGALGGGDTTVKAGRDVSDLNIVSDTSVTTADTTVGIKTTQVLWTVGGGDVRVAAGRDIIGGRLDVASGTADLTAGGAVRSDGTLQYKSSGERIPNDLRVRVTDATVSISAGQDVALKGIAALGITGASNEFQKNLNGRGFYSPISGVSVLANSGVAVDNINDDVVSPSDKSTQLTRTAVWPGSFSATSFTGDLTLVGSGVTAASSILLYPSPTGQLVLLAGGDIAPVTIAMSDADPGILPGYFSSFQADQAAGVTAGRTFIFPGVLPSTSDVDLRALHNQDPTHAGDTQPVRIYAGGDISNMILSVPKAAHVGAGRDLINMMFFGQNLSAEDITRIFAGRDITATTRLMRPLLPSGQFGNPLAALQGNTFVLGGPGSFFLEAGRDAGPFLNSATTNGFVTSNGSIVPAGEQSYAGGVSSVGNDWNPWLDAKGADLYVMFGVGKGAEYDAFRDYYLDPANLASLDGDLFTQIKDSAGNLTPDRSKPIYAPILIKWMQDHASLELLSTYGTQDVTFQQAYDAFKTLPELEQRVFILNKVYFNELTSTSVPDGPSYKQYSRGYRAINTLFPSSLGYTENDLTGGGNGANTVVKTGDLDLRLATIQTTRGGNIYILGPGGRVLAGSTVRTSQQAARRSYDGGRLFAGGVFNSPIIAGIEAIPVGYEGILTLRGGSIYTFTDTDFLLNQSRLFTEAGGDIAMWSSNGDLNAGQGPKTSATFPPVVVQIDENLFSEVDSVGGVSGAGIAAFRPSGVTEAPSVFLIAPRGTVDAGDAGVRVSGNLYIAAQSVANAENFNVSGSSFGVSAGVGVDVGAQTSSSATAAAAAQAATAVAGSQNRGNDQSVITVEVLGYIGGSADDEEEKKRRRGQH